MVTHWTVLDRQKGQTNSEKGRATEKTWSRMLFLIRENEIGLLPSENHLVVSSSSLCSTIKMDLLFKRQWVRFTLPYLQSFFSSMKSNLIFGAKHLVILCESSPPHFLVYILKYSSRPSQLIIAFFPSSQYLLQPATNLNDKEKIMASSLLSY